MYRQDSAQPEPVRLLWKGVWDGVLSAFFVVLVLLPAFDALGLSFDGSTVMGAVGEAFFKASIPEEAVKMLYLWLLLRKNPYFDEHLDGIVYATCVGLGFAGLENILYLVSNMDSLAYLAVMRGLFAVPGHFFDAVAMGFFISLAHFGNVTQSTKVCYYILAFVVPFCCMVSMMLY